MRLVGAEVRAHRLRFREPYVAAAGVGERRPGAIVRLEDAEGRVGLGEVAPLAGRTEEPRAALRAARAALTALRAAGAWPEAEPLKRLDAACPELTNAPAARAAVVQALADLAARRSELPLALWWARRGGGAPPAARVPVNATLPGWAPEEAAAAARRAAAAGFACVKLKVGRSAESDEARARAVREAVPELSLRLDANGAWTEEEARRRLRALGPIGIEYVEQPLPRGEEEAMARLRRTVGVRLAADESVTGPEAARELVRRGACDVLVLKAPCLGGADRLLVAGREAEEAGIPAVVTSAMDGVVGRLGALHAAAALGERTLPCGLATAAFLAGDPAEGPERVEDGWSTVPSAPGAGARLLQERRASG